MTDERALFVISVAAELAGVHPQTLRMYERKGLIRPQRTAGNTRRYSQADIDIVRLIQELTQDRGMNLAGVEMVIALQQELERALERMQQLQERLELLHKAQQQTALVPLRDARSPFDKRERRGR